MIEQATRAPLDRRLIVLLGLLLPIVGVLGAVTMWAVYSAVTAPDFPPDEARAHLSMLGLLLGGGLLCIALALWMLMRQKS